MYDNRCHAYKHLARDRKEVADAAGEWGVLMSKIYWHFAHYENILVNKQSAYCYCWNEFVKIIVIHVFYGAIWCWCWNVSLKKFPLRFSCNFFSPFLKKTGVCYFLNHKSTNWQKLMKVRDTKWASLRFILLFEFLKKLQPFSRNSDLESSKNSRSHCTILHFKIYWLLK